MIAIFCSIALHMYDQEMSGCFVSLLISVTRRMANSMVMTTSEKIPVRASFLVRGIRTCHRMAKGIVVTNLSAGRKQ